MNLLDRLERRQPSENIAPFVERRQPEWVRRAQEGRLPNSDRTGKVAA